MLTYELKKSPGVPLYEALHRCIRADILAGKLTAGQIGRRKPENVVWVLSGCFLYSILCSGKCLHHITHVFCQIPDGADTLGILSGLAGLGAVDAVPILARGDGHTADGKIFV